MKKHIPNAITLCNLICGCVAVKYAFQNQYLTALAFIIAGAVFDFFDGFTARKLKVSSPIGVELDSLADVITFGFAPSAMMFSLIGSYTYLYVSSLNSINTCQWMTHLNIIAFMIAGFSALRLAKFNLDKRQTTSFIGLPTPANALLLASVVITLSNHPEWLKALCLNAITPSLLGAILLIILSVVSSLLLVSELPLFALKFKNFSWKDNTTRYIFLLSSALLLIIMAVQSLTRVIASLGAIIVWYIILSLTTSHKAK